MRFPFFGKKDDGAGQVDFGHLPRHLAVIMDGNGRWARRRGLPRSAGHKAGAETFRTIATYCREIGLDYLTVYAFSTENWKRPPEEVEAIMDLLARYLQEAIETMARDNVRLKFLGDMTPLRPDLRALIDETNRISAGLDGCQANICLNYGGRDEIVHAVSELVRLGETDINEDTIAAHLYTAGIPDPDLIIRPSGELRLSNFLLWQCAYSEFYFTNVLWPDFSKEELHRAIAAYQQRDRRYGGVKK